jgi:thioredoxin reductase (NADPH)
LNLAPARLGEGTMSHSKVVIVGSGSAGLTAALYTARANLGPIVLKGREPGGQLTWTTEVDNFPGFPDGVMGPELMERMEKQATRFGADCRFETVLEVDLSKRPFRLVVTTDPSGDPSGDRREYTADAVIVTTGASARWLDDVPSERPFRGQGVSTCATCDGAFYKNRPIAVVGGGDSAVEEATYLTRFASKVTLIHRRDSLRASKIMQDRAAANPKIEFAWNSQVAEVHGELEPHKVVKGVTLRSTKDGSTRDIAIDGLFVAIGHIPNTSVFQGQLAMTSSGYLLTRNALAWENADAGTLSLSDFPHYGTATNVEGVFAAGDVVDTHYRQAITAAGAGCAAAIDCEKWLESLEH